VGKYVIVQCNRCGKSEEVYSKGEGSKPAFHICNKCKLEIERKPKELMRTLGLGVESEHRRDSEAKGVSYSSKDREDFEKRKREVQKDTR